MSTIGQYFTQCFNVLIQFFAQNTYLGNIVLIGLAIGLVCAVVNLVLFIVRQQ